MTKEHDKICQQTETQVKQVNGHFSGELGLAGCRLNYTVC